MDEKQWGKRRRDREQGIERKRIRETVGGEGGREKERGEEKEPDTRIISYPDCCIKLLTGLSWFLPCLFTP